MSNRTRRVSHPETARVYQIELEGQLGTEWAEWFDDLRITITGDGDTLLTGPIADQSTLRGILDRIWNLNLVLIYVERQVVDSRVVK